MDTKVFKVLRVIDGEKYKDSVLILLKAIREVALAAYSVEVRNVVAGMLQEMANELRIERKL
jgi:hypothetical protein